MQLWLLQEGLTTLLETRPLCIRTNAYLHAPSTIEKKYSSSVSVVGLSSSIVL